MQENEFSKLFHTQIVLLIPYSSNTIFILIQFFNDSMNR